MRRKSIIFWVLFLLVLLSIRWSGHQAEVLGFIQRLTFYIGLHQPDIDPKKDQEQWIRFDYNTQLLTEENEIIDFKRWKGKVLFINFWATWCPPCVAELPDIQKVYEELPHDKIEWVMINQDKRLQVAKKFLKRKAYDFSTYHLYSSWQQDLSFNAIPTTLVVNAEGYVVFRHSGIANYNTKAFKKFLSEL